MVSQTVRPQQYLNLFGKVDENAEREKRYQTALLEYPASTKTGCDQLEALVSNINLKLNEITERRASTVAAGGSGRIEDRELYGYGKRKTELESMYNNLQCAQIKNEAEQKKFYETQVEQLEKVTELGKDTGNATKYIVWGMLGIVVVIATIIIIKKTKS